MYLILFNQYYVNGHLSYFHIFTVKYNDEMTLFSSLKKVGFLLIFSLNLKQILKCIILNFCW